jgi:chitodextrinase
MSLQRFLFAAVLTLSVHAGAAQSCDSTLQRISFDTDAANYRAIAMASSGLSVGVAKIRTGSPNEINFGLYDTLPNQAVSDVTIGNSLAGPISLATNGTDFGLIYQDSQFREVYQRIGPDGRPIGGPVLLFGTAISQSGKEYSQVLWNGSAWVLARTAFLGGTGTVHLTAFDLAGNLIYDRLMPLLTDGPATPEIAVRGTTTAVLWRGTDVSGVIHLFYVVTDVTQPSQVLIPHQAAGTNPRIVWDESAFFVVTSKEGSTSELDSFRFDANGVMVQNPVFFIAATAVDIAANSLVVTPEGLAVEYSDSIQGFAESPGNLHVRRFSADGTIQSDVNVTLTFGLSNFRPTARMISVGPATLSTVAIRNQLNGGWDSLFVKLCPLTLTIDVPPLWPAGEAVDLTAHPSGGVAPYAVGWEFGDGAHLNGSTVTHRYGVPRTYTVTVRVTDATGTSVETTRQIVIANLAPLTISMTPNTSGIVGRVMTFSASTSGGVAPVRVTWTFGDGSPGAAGTTVLHTFASPGTYSVQVSAVDATGDTVSDLQVVIVLGNRRHAVERH